MTKRVWKFDQSFLDDPDLSDELKDAMWSYFDCRPWSRYEQVLEDCIAELEYKNGIKGHF